MAEPLTDGYFIANDDKKWAKTIPANTLTSPTIAHKIAPVATTKVCDNIWSTKILSWMSENILETRKATDFWFSKLVYSVFDSIMFLKISKKKWL